jgi:spore germination protein KA
MLIAVALSGIAGLMIPRLRAAVFYLRLGLVLAASSMGLFGYMAGFGAVVVRILSLLSFGVDATPALSELSAQSMKDTVIRAHFGAMRTRPHFNKNKIRMKNQSEGGRGREDR